MTRHARTTAARSKIASSPPAATPSSSTAETFLLPGLAIFVAALAIRLIHLWQIRAAPYFDVLMGDARAYDAWGQRIAAGDWIGREVFYQAPLYPYFLGAIYQIAGHDLVAVRVCQAILGSASCVLLALSARRLVSRGAGIAAGAMFAAYAPAIFFDGLIQKAVLDVFLMCLTIWLTSRLIEDEAALAWLWPGLSVAALSLTRENGGVIAAALIACALLRRGVSTRTRLAGAAAFALGLALVLTPVALRNYAVGGGFYLTTSQFGPNFYIGNNPNADGTYMSLRFGRGAPEYERQDATQIAERDLKRSLTPAEVSSYWTTRALRFIRDQPGAWAALIFRKFALLWNADEMLDTESQESYAEYSVLLRVLGVVGHFGVIVPTAVLGGILLWPLRRRLWIVAAMFVAYAASVVVFYVFARYRHPLAPFLILFAAGGLTSLRTRWATATPRTAVATAGAVVCAAVFANWPLLSTDLMQAITDVNLGTALQEQGRVDEAADQYRRALARRPDYAPAHGNLGVSLRARGRTPEAIEAYRQALSLQPDYPTAHYNLANALLSQGAAEEAVQHFQRALESMPGSIEAHTNLGMALDALGRSDAALAEYTAALALDPRSAKSHRNLGNALASRGDPARALEHFRQAVQLAPEDGEARYDLGAALIEARDFEDAVNQLRIATRLLPAGVEARNNLGIALASQGKLDEAIEAFRDALRLRPDFADARRNLSTALQARQRPDGGKSPG